MSGGLLLDTCTLLWLAADQSRLSARARDAIAAESAGLHVSAITAFEIGVKHAQGRIVLPMDPWRWLRTAIAHHGLFSVSITARIALEATRLPALHRDPCDRIIVATARRRRMTIVTPDERIAAYPNVRTLW
ncbi:MAG: type II toxin-antitoxin system VapC family toxin [Gemmatimonadaceae bacterium]|nr:type II toxin-antitoxin system VapC family toxin [Phycisphaerae bacterium]NUQ10987.1 type II toxin-antitoxin system VapC family toxin [Gemmatimonadaceae bacterium]